MKDILSGEGILAVDPVKDKKTYTKRFKNSLKGLLVLSGIYLFLTMIILVGCIWQVDSGTYRIVGTIMVFMIPVFLFELSRCILWYKLMTEDDKDGKRKKENQEKDRRTSIHASGNADTDGRNRMPVLKNNGG